MTVAVTGASGHIGANLVRALLAEGRPVRALVHCDARALEGLELETVRGDICDIQSLRQAFDGAETVYHLAAHVSIRSNEWPWLESVNITGTRNVVDACLDRGVKRLVHFSSIHAIQQEPFDRPVDESSPLVGRRRYLPYDCSKADSEREVCKGINRGLDAVIINPTGVIGPYDYKPSHFGEALLKMARGTLPGLVNGGFDWVDARDVVQAAIKAEHGAPRGSQYILSGHWASIKQLALLVEELTGVATRGPVFPLWIAGCAAPAITVFDRACRHRSLYTRASLKTLHSNCNISHDKAAWELGFNPRPLKETIGDTLEWFAGYGWLANLAPEVETPHE